MKIIGVGSYLPENILTNIQIQENVNTTDIWIQENLGIIERRISKLDEFSSDLALKSTLNALNDANMTINDVDFIILCTSSPDRISPSTSCILQKKLNLKNVPCVDINAVCSGFIYGLQLANGLLKTKQYKNILLVASETYSKLTDWTKRDCVFFGDGSGAVLLQDDNNLFEIDLYSDGDGYESFTVPIGGKFKMKGKEVNDNALLKIPQSINKLLNRLSINKNEIDFVIPHQPNLNLLKKISEVIDVDFNKFGITVNKFGNTAGASIPITLDYIYKQGKIKKNDLILFTAIGSGWTWGSGIISWQK